jgi:LAO/AO transport system kinase
LVNTEVQRLIADMQSGKIRALSRAISWVESQTPESSELLEKVYACAKAPWVIGITGVGGSGKSSLVPHIAKYFANQGHRVAVLAVDPSSPITGGALLGDRIRDNGGQQHPNIFFRSVASRGGQGGLATCVSDLTRVVSTAGFDVVLIETVGAGQSELAILNVAHTIMLIHAPGLGDDIQAQKAGVMEIADVLVVNKADKPGAQDAVLMLQQALLLSEKKLKI